jgi:hypothetical protein
MELIVTESSHAELARRFPVVASLLSEVVFHGQNEFTLLP